MLTELNLVGLQHASERLHWALQKDWPREDHLLFLFDFLEEALVRGFEIPEITDQFIKDLPQNELNAYERQLLQIYNGDFTGSETILQLSRMAPEISWANYIRLLALNRNANNQISSQEIQSQLQLILNALDSHSKSLWIQRYKNVLGTKGHILFFEPQTSLLKYRGQAVDLSRKKTILLLVKALVKNSQYNVEQMIFDIWQSSFSMEHYHRLRMLILRLNRELQPLTGLEKIITIDLQTVQLKDNVTLRGLEA